MARQLIKDLMNSPLALALLATLLIYVIVVALFGPRVINEISATLTAVIGVTVFVVYGRAWWRSIRQQTPSAWHCVIVGVGCVATGYSIIRIMQIVWLEIGRPAWFYDTPLFGLATTILIFGGLCHLLAQGAGADGSVGRRGWTAVLIALVCGTLLGVLLWLF